MSISRQSNFLGQMRVDVLHLRSIDSSIANDFDLLVGKLLSGKKPLVIKGFTLSTSGTLGTAADSLALNVADSIIAHFNASESGTIFATNVGASPEILSSTNSKVEGSFSASSFNYIGLDLLRIADETTSDIVQFLDITTKLESGQDVPLGRTLQFKITVSVQSFASSENILPIAIVKTDSNNNIESITDARKMMFRLGSGGDAPNATSSFVWGTRKEDSIIYNLANSTANPFTGEDKSIGDLKSWMDAVTTSIWETKGGSRWFSPQNRDNVKLAYGPLVIPSNGDNFEFTLFTQTLQWKDLRILFENGETSPTDIYYNTIVDGQVSSFEDGHCLYVDVDRDSNSASIIPVSKPMADLGSSSIPGRRIILAWRKGNYVYTRDRAYEAGRSFTAATSSALGINRISRDYVGGIATSGTSSNPIVISELGGTITSRPSSGLYGLKATGNQTGHGLWGVGGSGGAPVAGVKGEGGTTTGDIGGKGGEFIGGDGDVGYNGGLGIDAIGGTGGGVGGIGGTGIHATGGGTDGIAGYFQGTTYGHAIEAHGGSNSLAISAIGSSTTVVEITSLTSTGGHAIWATSQNPHLPTIQADNTAAPGGNNYALRAGSTGGTAIFSKGGGSGKGIHATGGDSTGNNEGGYGAVGQGGMGSWSSGVNNQQSGWGLAGYGGDTPSQHVNGGGGVFGLGKPGWSSTTFGQLPTIGGTGGELRAGDGGDWMSNVVAALGTGGNAAQGALVVGGRGGRAADNNGVGVTGSGGGGGSGLYVVAGRGGGGGNGVSGIIPGGSGMYGGVGGEFYGGPGGGGGWASGGAALGAGGIGGDGIKGIGGSGGPKGGLGGGLLSHGIAGIGVSGVGGGVQRILYYDSRLSSIPFAPGSIIIGIFSSATATVTFDSNPSGFTGPGYLVIHSEWGSFTLNEPIATPGPPVTSCVFGGTLVSTIGGSGTGVRGIGGAPNGIGGVFVGAGTGSAIEASNSSSITTILANNGGVGPAFQSTTSGINIPQDSPYGYNGPRTRAVLVSAMDFTVLSGTPTFNPADHSISSSSSSVLQSSVRIPAGATITDFSIHAANSNPFTAITSTLYILDYDFAVGTPTNIFFPLSTPTKQWLPNTNTLSMVVPTGATGSTNGCIQLRVNLISSARFYGARLTYTYTHEDVNI